ncbi:hypothetical protein [Paenibacillus sp.]|nr:hypothetical protein [Paenibacillus sp.]HZG87300.1 hypothetical protein [Paenibacillus sp.]
MARKSSAEVRRSNRKHKRKPETRRNDISRSWTAKVAEKIRKLEAL